MEEPKLSNEKMLAIIDDLAKMLESCYSLRDLSPGDRVCVVVGAAYSLFCKYREGKYSDAVGAYVFTATTKSTVRHLNELWRQAAAKQETPQ